MWHIVMAYSTESLQGGSYLFLLSEFFKVQTELVD